MKHEGRVIPKEEILANRSNAYEFIDFICKDCNKSLEDCTCINDTLDMKQKTLEEAAKQKFQQCGKHLKKIGEIGFKEGAKWQQERMYSEEEVGAIIYNIVGEIAEHHNIIIDGEKLNERFEQFKKK